MPLPSVILDWMSISFPMVSCLNCALGLRSVFACNVESTAALSNLSPRCFARMNFVLPAGRKLSCPRLSLTAMPCCMSLSEKSSKLVARYSTEEICLRKVSFTVSNFFCLGCCPAAVRAAFSRSSFNWPRLRAQYSASLTRSFEPLSRSIWYSPAPSHSSMTSTRKCRMVWAVLECFIPSRQSRGFCI